MDRTGQTHYVKLPGVVSSRGLSNCSHMSTSSQQTAQICAVPCPNPQQTHRGTRLVCVPATSPQDSLSTPLLSAYLLSAFSCHFKGEEVTGIEPRCCACKQNLHFFCTETGCFQSGCCSLAVKGSFRFGCRLSQGCCCAGYPLPLLAPVNSVRHKIPLWSKCPGRLSICGQEG